MPVFQDSGLAMPEGPEIRRSADAVRSAICNRQAAEVWFWHAHLKSFEPQLRDRTIVAIETYGKAMLTRFDNGLNIYSHNQLYGRWLVVAPGEKPETNRQLRLAIKTETRWALLYSASDIAVLSGKEVPRHPFLSSIGPDVLSQDTTVETLLERLQSDQFCKRRLGGLLTDQKCLAGLGNYLRCEILFVSKLSPAIRPIDLSYDQSILLAENILALSQQSYETCGITNHRETAENLLANGTSFEEARFHVFRRAGKPCYHCGTKIIKIQSGGQACYLCPV